ncbi:hypothetical protein D3C77_179310 [compost metagenome]
MPQFISAPLNTHAYFGQHYSRRSLRPGKHVFEAGICLGLTLSWLKKVQVGCHWANLPTCTEATLVQHIAAYGYSTRICASNDWSEAQEIAALAEEARTVSPGMWVQDPQLKRLFQLQGFQARYLGEQNAFRILFQLDGLRAGGTQTFLLTAAAHAIGLAIRDGKIAVFDANKGLTLFTVEEALDNALLMQHLQHHLEGSAFPFFGVMALDF